MKHTECVLPKCWTPLDSSSGWKALDASVPQVRGVCTTFHRVAFPLQVSADGRTKRVVGAGASLARLECVTQPSRRRRSLMVLCRPTIDSHCCLVQRCRSLAQPASPRASGHLSSLRGHGGRAGNTPTTPLEPATVRVTPSGPGALRVTLL